MNTVRTAGLALAGLLASVTLAACGGSSDDADPAAAPSTAVVDPANLKPVVERTIPAAVADPTATGKEKGGRKATGTAPATKHRGGGRARTHRAAQNPADLTTGQSATDPSSPFVVAAAAVGTRSRDQVLQIHALALATTKRRSTLPADQIPGIAAVAKKALQAQIADATMATPPPGSAAADLVAALKSYRDLAGTLAGWDQRAALPAGFFADLAQADTAWKDALRRLGALAHTDLLAKLPALVMPS